MAMKLDEYRDLYPKWDFLSKTGSLYAKTRSAAIRGTKSMLYLHFQYTLTSLSLRTIRILISDL